MKLSFALTIAAALSLAAVPCWAQYAPYTYGPAYG